MSRRIVYVLGLLAACDKKAADSAKHEATVADTVAASPACTAKVKELEPWLAKLAVETKSHEVDFGYILQVIDREPMPVETHVDDVEMTKKSIRAWDVSQGNHVDSKLPDHATPAQLTEFLTKLARPPGVEDTTKTAEAEQAASDQLEAFGKICKPLHRVSMGHRHGQVVADAAAYAKDTAAALLACGCAPDPDELRKLAWIDGRWHQAAPRVGVVLELDGAATTTIALPAKTPWSEAHVKLLDTTGPVKLAAK